MRKTLCSQIVGFDVVIWDLFFFTSPSYFSSQVRYDGLRTFLEEDGSTLSVEDVSAHDAGIYTCEAHNGVGTPIRRSVQLNVLGAYAALGATASN